MAQTPTSRRKISKEYLSKLAMPKSLMNTTGTPGSSRVNSNKNSRKFFLNYGCLAKASIPQRRLRLLRKKKDLKTIEQV